MRWPSFIIRVWCSKELTATSWNVDGPLWASAAGFLDLRLEGEGLGSTGERLGKFTLAAAGAAATEDPGGPGVGRRRRLVAAS